MEIGKEIIETLKEAREAKGLSQRALAARSKVPQSHISKIERGQVDIQLSSLVELARVLELEVKLIPRRVVQVVDGVIRHAAPTAERDQQARVHGALAKATTIADRLSEYDKSQTLYHVRDAAHALQGVRIPAEYQDDVHSALAALGRIESVSPDTYDADEIVFLVESARSALKSSAKRLQKIRNRIAHSQTTGQEQARPAYRLGEDGDNG